jgi:hypothetical protein
LKAAPTEVERLQSNSREGGAGGGDGGVDVGVGVGGGDEEGFELRRREENSAVDHLAEEGGEAAGVRFFCGGVIANRLGREKQRKQRARDVDVAGDARLAERCAKAVGEALVLFVEFIGDFFWLVVLIRVVFGSFVKSFSVKVD